MTYRAPALLSGRAPRPRLFPLCLLLMLFAITLPSCKSASKEDDDREEENKPTDELLQGFWEEETENNHEALYLFFREDGTVTDLRACPDPSLGILLDDAPASSYALDGKKLTLDNPYAMAAGVYHVFKLDDNTLVIGRKDLKEKLTFRRIDQRRFAGKTGVIFPAEEKAPVTQELVAQTLEPKTEAEAAPTVKTECDVKTPEMAAPDRSKPKEPAAEVEVKTEPSPKSVHADPDQVFTAVEQQASFPGGGGALSAWLTKNLRYPEAAAMNNVQGRVIVQFIVETDGSITNVTVARGVDGDLDREAMRVIKKMPKWNPARNNGVAVRSKFTMPVAFRLTN